MWTVLGLVDVMQPLKMRAARQVEFNDDLLAASARLAELPTDEVDAICPNSVMHTASITAISGVGR